MPRSSQAHVYPLTRTRGVSGGAPLCRGLGQSGREHRPRRHAEIERPEGDPIPRCDGLAQIRRIIERWAEETRP